MATGQPSDAPVSSLPHGSLMPDGTCVYIEKERCNSLFLSAKRCYEEGLYSDVTLIVKGSPFQCHKMVLASLSDYFPPLFQYQPKGEDILLNEVPTTAKNFATILKFAYTGELQLSNENVQDILITANFFGILFITTTCETFMSNNLESENVCDALQFATSFSLKILSSKAEEFICRNLDSVSQTTGYQNLDPQFLLTFFDNENLILHHHGKILSSVLREEMVLNAVLRYLSKISPPDESLLDSMIQKVRLPIIPKTKIKQCLKLNKSLEKNDLLKKYKKLAEKAAKYLKDCKKPSGIDAEAFPKSWFLLRKPAAFKFILGERRYASTGQVNYHNPPEFPQNDPEVEIKKIEVWIRRWDGRPVLGGIKISYRGIMDDEIERKYSKGSSRSSWEKHEAVLEPQEKITKVLINSGWMIDCIGFVTSEKRKIGPFGGPGGGEHSESAPQGPDSFLHDIACDEFMTQGALGLLNLQLRWITLN